MVLLDGGSHEERGPAAVLEWRLGQLRRSGYAFVDAILLAAHPDVDLHRATDIVAGGCPPDLARRILL
jgi:hypothetical protein